MIFANLIAHKISLRLLKDLYNSVRVNPRTDVQQEKVFTNIGMIKEDYDNELKGLSLDLTNLDNTCLPCKNTYLKVRTGR